MNINIVNSVATLRARIASLTTLPLKEPSNPHSYLHSIDARIRHAQAGIGNMQIAQLDRPVILLAEDVRADRKRWHEVDVVRARRNIVVGKEHPAAKLGVRRKRSVRGEGPIQVDGIESRAIGSIGGLKNKKHWNRIHGVFEAPFQEAGAVRVGDDPSITQANIPCARIAAPAWDGMASAGPNGDVVAPGLGGVFLAVCSLLRREQPRTHAEETQY